MYTNYNVVLIEKALDEGMTRSEIFDLLDLVSGEEYNPIEIEGNNSVAMGFIDYEIDELIDFDHTQIENFVKEILNDIELENDDCSYEIDRVWGKITVWLSR